MNHNLDTAAGSTSLASRRRHWRRRKLVAAGLASLTVTAGMLLASAEISSADGTSRDYTVESFRETIKPLDSVTIPRMQCHTGWLVDHDYSPGRIVPKGVEITGDSGWVGTSISHTVFDSFSTEIGYIRANYGTKEQGAYSATNWDPFTSHELVINLHCSTDPGKASLRPDILGFPES